jgi:lipoprotein-anchoring transpeptidase ErfK/SrfK
VYRSVEFGRAVRPVRRGVLGVIAALLLASTALPAKAQWRSDPWGWDRPAYQPSYQQNYQQGYQPGRQQQDLSQHPAKKVVAKKPKKKETDKVEKVAAPKGPLHIIVSISSQRVKVYDGANVIAEASVSTGTAGHPTPTGVFSVIQKNRFHKSNIYSDAPMPFMQRLTWSGIALHEGKLPGYPASHGCIRLPAEFAHKLWGMTKLGVRVIVAPSDVTPVEITHPALFTRKLQALDEKVAQLRPSIVDDGRDPLIPMSDADPVQTGDAAAAVQPAVASTTIAETSAEGDADGPVLWKVKPIKSDSAESGKSPPLRAGPVSVFVSRKEGRLFVRKGFATVFDVPVTIREPQAPIGTHVFTAVDAVGNSAEMRWVAMTLPGEPSGKRADDKRADPGRNVHLAANLPRGNKDGVLPVLHGPAAAALDRIEIPQEASDRIAAMLGPGASLIISDQGRGDETGLETDFVILTR